MQRKEANNAEKKWPAFRDNFSKGWQLLSFPWSKRHLFQLVLTAMEAIQRGEYLLQRENKVSTSFTKYYN